MRGTICLYWKKAVQFEIVIFHVGLYMTFYHISKIIRNGENVSYLGI